MLGVDIKDTLIDVLARIGYPLRLPTLRWLMSDVTGALDNQVNSVIDELIKSGQLTLSSGGWISL